MALPLPLQSWELALMRDAVGDQLFTDTVAIHRRTPVSTATGGQTEGYVVWQTVLGRLEENPIRNEEKALGAGQKAESWWIVSLAYDLEVRVSDRYIINGQTYEVTETEGARSQSTVQNVKCRKVRV